MYFSGQSVVGFFFFFLLAEANRNILSKGEWIWLDRGLVDMLLCFYICFFPPCSMHYILIEMQVSFLLVAVVIEEML